MRNDRVIPTRTAMIKAIYESIFFSSAGLPGTSIVLLTHGRGGDSGLQSREEERASGDASQKRMS
jgi:hypothetical protein